MALFDESSATRAGGLRATNSVCEWLAPDRARVDGRELALPVSIEDCAILASVFSVDAGAVRALLDDPRLSVAALPFDRTFLVLLGVLYRESPLGAYGEAAVLFPVLTGTRRALSFPSLLGMLTGTTPELVYRMPVDREFTMHAGRFLWGYPKYLAQIDVAFGARDARVRLAQDGEEVFAFSAPASERGRLPESKGTNLTVRDGVVRTICARASGEGVAMRLGGPEPTLGTRNPLARDLRTLGLPKAPLVTASVRRARLGFDAAEEAPLTASSGTR